jgi:curved DNA-binding protein CbpA
MTDYYKILEISPDAGEKEIRAAYRKLAKTYHPDAGAGSSAERFRAVQDAYELLSDSEKRREYDQGRRADSWPARTYAGTSVWRYSAPSSHIDLREVLNPRARAYPEPVEFRPSGRERDDPLDELLEFLFRF